MIVDGKKIAQQILDELKIEISRLPFQPLFCDVLVGDDPVALSYVRIKGRTAEQIGLKFRLEQLPATVSQKELIDYLSQLSGLPNMCGLIVQLPLPRSIDRQAILDAIEPAIDVDVLGTFNKSLFYENAPSLIPPTAAAIIKLLDSLPIELNHQKILVIGQGQLVGKPVTHLLQQRGLTVDAVTIETKNLTSKTRVADIIISGTGQPHLITGNMLKPASVIIDAGTAEMDGGIVGDVDFESAAVKAKYLTPVPGGVGPVTVSMLLYNVVMTAKLKFSRNSHSKSGFQGVS